MGKILLANIEADKRKQIRTIAKELGHRTLAVNRADYGRSLGSLAGFEGMSDKAAIYTGPEFSVELMVFSSFTSEEIDLFLDKYNESGLSSVKYKAMITPSNVGWNLLRLVDELGIEIKEIG